MESMIKLLKKEGITLTPQRLAIVQCLEGNKTHPSADEIYSIIRSQYPTISKATVYSTLQLLRDKGAVKELSIRKRGEACFDPSTKKHHHFLCRKCDRIIDINIEPDDESNIIKAITSQGHKVEEVQFYIYGICSGCLEETE